MYKLIKLEIGKKEIYFKSLFQLMNNFRNYYGHTGCILVYVDTCGAKWDQCDQNGANFLNFFFVLCFNIK
jgi:hypothetical protein